MNEPNPVVIADRYEVIGILGEGGMGVVYKAHDRLLEIAVALKVMRERDAATTSIMMLRFQQEAKAAGRLNHPNIARIMDFGQLSGKLYMVMELLDGIPLSQLIEERGHLSAEDALPLFIDICEGLVHAHKNGVLHRDLKPSNIILTTGDGMEIAKIVDFGIAKLSQSQELTATGTQIGSPLYMSPEQVKGNQADSRSDIYSMGCVMYEVLSGNVPIKAGSALETLHAKTREPAPTLAQANGDVPKDLIEIVDRCLAINPDDRYKQMSDLSKALTKCEESIEKNQDLFLPEEEIHEEPIKRTSNKAVLLWAAGLCVLSLTSAATWWFVSRGESEQKKVRLDFQDPMKDDLDSEMAVMRKQSPFKYIKGGEEIEINSASENVDSQFKQLQGKRIKRLLMEHQTDATGSGLVYLDKNSLTNLQIDNTQFQSENLRLVAQFHNLEVLSLRYLNINKNDLKNLESLKKLNYLDIAGLKELDDEGFKFVERLKTLEILSITDCKKLGDGYTSSIFTLPKLNLLSISRTPLNAAGIKRLGTIKALTILDLSAPNLSDENVEALSQLPNVTQLKIRDAELTPEMIEVLSKMPRMNSLTLGGSRVKITPTVIKSLSQMSKLKDLNFEYNWMEPDDFRAVAELKHIASISFMEVRAKPGSLSYLLDMPGLLIIRDGKSSFSNAEFKQFLREYSLKWKRQLKSFRE